MKNRWVARLSQSRDHLVTTSHWVESEIEDRVVTECGRQMKKNIDGAVLTFTDAMFSDKCKRCHGQQEG